MKRGIIAIICLSFILTILFIPGIIAPYEETEENSGVETSSVTSITLTAAGNEIEWEVEGYSENGFKIVWSKNPNPTYPLREGDQYHYYTDPSEDSDILEAFNGEGEYYVRVCEYLGGKCGIYSNEIKVNLIGEETQEKEDYEECSDSDGGVNFGVKGKLKDLAHNAEYEDFCVGSNGTVVESGKTLREHYCGEENYQYKYYNCTLECKEGACIGEEYEEEKDEQESSEVTSITLTSEGNKIKWEVEGYSENGFKVVWSKNENPSYPVRNGDRYHYYSDWDEREDTLEAFNGKGEYYVRVCEYLGGRCGVYSNQLKVSLTGDETQEKELEDKYEDENEIEDDEDETEEGTNNIEHCNGCLVEEVCYPLGFRKAGQYCFDEFEFVNQSAEDAPCDNNFECSSNLCMDGSCVSGSLIKKVMNWLKNFFN